MGDSGLPAGSSEDVEIPAGTGIGPRPLAGTGTNNSQPALPFYDHPIAIKSETQPWVNTK